MSLANLISTAAIEQAVHGQPGAALLTRCQFMQAGKRLRYISKTNESLRILPEGGLNNDDTNRLEAIVASVPDVQISGNCSISPQHADELRYFVQKLDALPNRAWMRVSNQPDFVISTFSRHPDVAHTPKARTKRQSNTPL